MKRLFSLLIAFVSMPAFAYWQVGGGPEAPNINGADGGANCASYAASSLQGSSCYQNRWSCNDLGKILDTDNSSYYDVWELHATANPALCGGTPDVWLAWARGWPGCGAAGSRTVTGTFNHVMHSGDTVCTGSCLYTYSPATHAQDAQKTINMFSASVAQGTVTNTGDECSAKDFPSGNNTFCFVSGPQAGQCIKWNPNSGYCPSGKLNCDPGIGGDPLYCDSTGVCTHIPQPGGDPATCATGAKDAICMGQAGQTTPSGTTPPPGPNPPPPPSPPILPNAPQNSPNVSVYSSQQNAGTPDPFQWNNQGTQTQCGGVGQLPCATGPGACSGGTHSDGLHCVANATCQPPATLNADGATCSDGSSACVSGTTWSDALEKCVSDTPPSCTAPLVMDNNGQCVTLTCGTGYTAVNGICEPTPPTCSGGTIVNGVCQPTCTAGKTYVAGTGCVQISSTTCNGGTLTGTGTTAVCTCTSPLVLINGTCSTPPPTVPCVGGTVISGMCVCSGNQTDQDGVCATPGSGGGGDGSGDTSKQTETMSQFCAANPLAGACAKAGGSATTPTDALYTSKTDTVSSVFSGYAASIQAAPIVSAMNGFFTINVGGSCPVLTIPAANIGGHNIWAGLNGNFLCDGTLGNILTLVGWIVLAAAAYEASRIALL